MKREAVPVALFVFNRYELLDKTLKCLRDNRISKLYVFSDGARNEQDEASIRKVRSIIDAINWADVTKKYRSKNKGLSKSIEDGLDEIFEKYESVIVIEDDVCVAPGFYDYMKTGLEYYKDNKKVACITGLRYPFDHSVLEQYPYDAFFAPRFSSWGWGTWKRFWQTVEFDNSKLAKKLATKHFDPNMAGEDMPVMIEQLVGGNLRGGWDINCAATILSHSQQVLWPVKNRVVNTGLRVGTHASGSLPFWRLKWETTLSQSRLNFPPSVTTNAQILSAFLDFFHYHMHPDEISSSSVHRRLRHKPLPLIERIRRRA